MLFEPTYLEMPGVLFERCEPERVRAPSMLFWNEGLGVELGLEALAGDAELWSGNAVRGRAEPLAQAYAGHQFGHFTMLGDGRAHVLGDRVSGDGRRVEVQLKGSGRTVFSRRGDGRAALEPMLREVLISEWMAAAGIPTTRCLAVVRTGETVRRERELPGAVLTRVAASHVRVGTFEYAAGCGDAAALPALVRYALARHVPGAVEAENPALALLEYVVGAQAELLAQWMLAGFVHGVMNTDNMAVSGETIDYGPCAFMDRYDPETVFSSIDRQGRYAYGNQPSMALWNLSRFAESLLTETDAVAEAAVEKAEGVLRGFEGAFRSRWLSGMRCKLGLGTEEPGDEVLIADLLEWMGREGRDYTRTFAELDPEGEGGEGVDAGWRERWRARLGREPEGVEAVRERMRSVNYRVIPRNHCVEEVLNAAGEGDVGAFERLLAVLRDPFGRQGAVPEVYLREPPLGHPPYVTYCGT